MASKFYAIIAGVGGGTGRSLALKFAATYPVVLVSRSAASRAPIVSEITGSGGNAVGVDGDVGDAASLRQAFDSIRAEMGDRQLAAAVFNVGGGFVRKPFLDLSEKEFRAGFESNGLGLFNFAQNAIPLLLSSASSSPPYPPTLLVTGATASLRGSALVSSFAAGKFSSRALAQSLAREFGPKGVHVGHVIIDGVIDTPHTKAYSVNDGVEDGKISPDGIADNFWHLHTQPRSSWTHELDIRPYVEKF